MILTKSPENVYSSLWTRDFRLGKGSKRTGFKTASTFDGTKIPGVLSGFSSGEVVSGFLERDRDRELRHPEKSTGVQLIELKIKERELLAVALECEQLKEKNQYLEKELAASKRSLSIQEGKIKYFTHNEKIPISV